jgi:hypothetical protein
MIQDGRRSNHPSQLHFDYIVVGANGRLRCRNRLSADAGSGFC